MNARNTPSCRPQGSEPRPWGRPRWWPPSCAARAAGAKRSHRPPAPDGWRTGSERPAPWCAGSPSHTTPPTASAGCPREPESRRGGRGSGRCRRRGFAHRWVARSRLPDGESAHRRSPTGAG